MSENIRADEILEIDALNQKEPIAPFVEYPDVVNVKQLCEMLGGISRALAYDLLNQQKITSVRIGRQHKILKQNILSFLSNKNV